MKFYHKFIYSFIFFLFLSFCGVCQTNGCGVLAKLNADLDANQAKLKPFFDSNGAEGTISWRELNQDPRLRADIDYLESALEVPVFPLPSAYYAGDMIRYGDDAFSINAESVLRNSIVYWEFKQLLPIERIVSFVELSSVFQYTKGAAFALNTALFKHYAQGVSLSPRFQSYEKVLKVAIEKLVKYEGTVHRGQALYQDKLNRYLTAWNNGNGTGLIIEPFFVSSTKVYNIAKGFMNLNAGPGRTKVLFEITSKKGADIDDISFYGSNFGPSSNPNHTGSPQQEVLFNSHTQFKITSIVPDTNISPGETVYVIKMTEL